MDRSQTWHHQPSSTDEKKSLRSRTFSQPRRLLLPQRTALLPSPLPSPPPQPLLERLSSAYPPNVSLAHAPTSPSTASATVTAQENALTRAFDALSRSALSATQRLDTAYESLLSRVEALHGVLEDLGRTYADMHAGREGFTAQAEKLRDQTGRVVQGYAGFEGQAKRVRGLAERLEGAKRKAASAKERLDAVRERIGVMQADELRRGREGWWLRLWITVVLSLISVGLLGVWIAHHGTRAEVGMHIDVAGETEGRWKILDEL